MKGLEEFGVFVENLWNQKREKGGSDHFKKYQVEPDHQKDVENNAHVKEDIEEFAVGEFVAHKLPFG